MRRLACAIGVVTAALAGCAGVEQSHRVASTGAPLLRIARLHGAVVRLGRLRGEPLYGVRLRADVCALSAAAADQTYPTSFRVSHHVTPNRSTTHWRAPFRALQNELHWLVPLGETTSGPCRNVDFEDVIPPPEYGGVESPLGCLGYCRGSRCYGIGLKLSAFVGKTAVSATRRTIAQCGRFRKPR